MNNKTVSVHIVTYNSADDIIDCLEAVMAQDYPIEKIVVVDNASSDDCAEKVNTFFNMVDTINSQANKEAPTSLLLIQNQKTQASPQLITKL